MSAVVFTRCPWGEYFRGLACPVDGYKNDVTAHVVSLLTEFKRNGTPISRNALREGGLDEESLREIVLVDFPEGAEPWLYLKPPLPDAGPSERP